MRFIRSELGLPSCASARAAATIGRSSVFASIASSIATYALMRCARPGSSALCETERGRSIARSIRSVYWAVARSSVICPEVTLRCSSSTSFRSSMVRWSAFCTLVVMTDSSSSSSCSLRASSDLSVSPWLSTKASRAPGSPIEAARLRARSWAEAVPAASWSSSESMRADVCSAVRFSCSDCQVIQLAVRARTKIGTASVARIFPRTPNLRSI